MAMSNFFAILGTQVLTETRHNQAKLGDTLKIG